MNCQVFPCESWICKYFQSRQKLQVEGWVEYPPSRAYLSSPLGWYTGRQWAWPVRSCQSRWCPTEDLPTPLDTLFRSGNGRYLRMVLDLPSCHLSEIFQSAEFGDGTPLRNHESRICIWILLPNEINICFNIPIQELHGALSRRSFRYNQLQWHGMIPFHPPHPKIYF